jgi:alkylhydroperoxidase/carboxymuconolactone decarboxylase family protein YurZ
MFYFMTSRGRAAARFRHEEAATADTFYPSSANALSAAHKQLTPELQDAFQAFSRTVFAEGALTTKTKQLIAVAVAMSRSVLFIRGHTEATMRDGANSEDS